MFKLVLIPLMMISASSTWAQSVVGSFEKEGSRISLLFDGRWGVVHDGEVECRSMPHNYVCIEKATQFSEEQDLAPIDVDLKEFSFADMGVSVGRSWGSVQSTPVGVSRHFSKALSSVYKVPIGRVRLLSTETGTIGNFQFFRYEFLIDLDNGPIWSTITRLKDSSRTVDAGTHVYGEIWATSPEMDIVRRDFHSRLL